MTPFNDKYVLALEVIDGSNLVVPSHRVPTGLYVSASTSLGQWSTSIKPVMADHSIRWEEPLVIRSLPLNFPRWLMPIFPSTWKAVHLEIRTSFETAVLGRGELMHKVDTTVGELLAHGHREQFKIPLSTTETRCPSLLLRARCIKPQQLSIQHLTRPRNVVIFGETGAGKSSVINAIAQDMCAKISNEATGCTRRHKGYNVNISEENFVIFDTVGLNEGTEGTVSAGDAAQNLKNLLRALKSTKSDGVDLLVYCVRCTRKCSALFKNYKYVYSTICQEEVPIVLVATGLEDYEPTMEQWWENNRAQYEKCSMYFKDHACITTIPKGLHNSAIIDQRIRESCQSLRSLILKNCLK